ncbi:MAG: serine hydrolase domain-containing protein [Pseudomonadota bacterium]
MRVAVQILCVLLLVGVQSACASDALQARLKELLNQSTIPSVSYAVVEDGEVTLIEELQNEGTDREEGAFRVGSLSKTVTTLLLMTLVDEGLLDLDTRVDSVLPDVQIANPWADTDPLRLVHLLEQTSGLPGTSHADHASVEPDYTAMDYATHSAHKLRWPPGRYFSYANGNHTLAAAMAEAVTGLPFDTLVKDRVLGPLGMISSSFDLTDPAVGRVRVSYDTNGEREAQWHLSVRPSGALVSPIDDLARLLVFLSDPQIGPVSRQTVARLRDPQSSLAARDGYKHIYGLGFFGFIAGGQMFWGHWGRIDGFQTTLGTLPDQKSGFVLVANGADRRVFHDMRETLAAHVARNIPALPPLEEAQGIDTGDLVGFWEPFTDDSLVRSWISKSIGLTRLEPTDDGSRLIARDRLGANDLLIPVSDRQFHTDRFPVVSHVFSRTPEDQIVMLGNGQLTYRRLNPVVGTLKWVWPWSAIAILVLACGAGFLGAVKLLTPGKPGSATRAALGLGVSGLCLLALHILYLLWGILGPLSALERLSYPSFSALFLAALSLTWPAAAIYAGICVIRPDPALRGLSRVLLGAVAFGLLVMALALFFEGWVPFLTWRR